MEACSSTTPDHLPTSPVRKEAADDKKQQTDGRNSAYFHLKTLWLFTRSDLKSMIYPNVVLGFVSALSGSATTTNRSPDLLQVLRNVPHVTLWLWLNLLLFNIANQRLPSSIIEDKFNKPWRPLPSGRLSPEQARVLLLLIVPTVLVCSLYLGAPTEVLLLISLTWMYNDLGGGDENFVIRNVINAFGMAFYGSGAIIIACGSQCELTSSGYQWIALIGGIVMTTLQVQDMSDQKGDAVRGRKTMPLVLGDAFVRWTIGVGVMGWSVVVPTFWKVGIAAYMPPLAVGGVLASRILVLRNVEADKVTWKLWCLWMISLYLLPLWLHLSGTVG